MAKGQSQLRSSTIRSILQPQGNKQKEEEELETVHGWIEKVDGRKKNCIVGSGNLCVTCALREKGADGSELYKSKVENVIEFGGWGSYGDATDASHAHPPTQSIKPPAFCLTQHSTGAKPCAHH